MYVLNLDKHNRILSACVMLGTGNYRGMPIVNALPEGDVTDYKYIAGEYVYEPIPESEEPEAQPSQLDVIEAQVTYTAMMTGTLLGV